jgi:GNAT superfamily N-acetyltransferase
MVKVRPLEKTDSKELYRLAFDFLKKEQRGEIVSKKILPLIRYKNYDKHLNEDVAKYLRPSPNKKVLVLEKNGRVIGYIYGRILRRPKMIMEKVGIVEDWFVEKEHRGSGISRLLWKELMEWFRKKKCDCVELDVFPTNKHAIEVYHQLGFIDEKIIMIKKL